MKERQGRCNGCVFVLYQWWRLKSKLTSTFYGKTFYSAAHIDAEHHSLATSQ